MMQSRKTVLDRNKKELIETINTENKVYTNEELSILVNGMKNELKIKDEKIMGLESQISLLKNSENKHIKSYFTEKYISGDSGANYRIKIGFPQQFSGTIVNVKLTGGYHYVNYGGLVDYTFGTEYSARDSVFYGFGENLIKKGALGDCISSISVSGTNYNMYVNINFNIVGHTNTGSDLYAHVTIYHYKNNAENYTVAFE